MSLLNSLEFMTWNKPRAFHKNQPSSALKLHKVQSPTRNNKYINQIRIGTQINPQRSSSMNKKHQSVSYQSFSVDKPYHQLSRSINRPKKQTKKRSISEIVRHIRKNYSPKNASRCSSVVRIQNSDCLAKNGYQKKEIKNGQSLYRQMLEARHQLDEMRRVVVLQKVVKENVTREKKSNKNHHSQLNKII